jgi:hypothetical protein
MGCTDAESTGGCSDFDAEAVAEALNYFLTTPGRKTGVRTRRREDDSEGPPGQSLT